MRKAAIIPAVLLLMALAPRASAALPVEKPACGTPIDHSIELGADVGSQASPCPVDGLDVAADNVTIVLNKLTIWGTPATGFGIAETGHNDVRITNGYVRGFFDVINLSGAPVGVKIDHMFLSGASHAGISIAGDQVTVKSNTIAGNTRLGIYGGPVTHAVITNNTISGNGIGGIDLTSGSDNATVTSNSVHGNFGSPANGIEVIGNNATVKKNKAQGNQGFGIYVVGDTAKIAKNKVIGNSDAGISVDGDAPVIVSNTADGNGWHPASGVALGIDASASAAPDGSDNLARNNGDPRECDPAVICLL